MKTSKIHEGADRIGIKQYNSGVAVSEIYGQVGASRLLYYNWKKKYEGLGLTELRELRQLKDEMCD